MKIGGFQKFSLLDYPGQLAAIVFTQGCNFRCAYCHNPELVLPEIFRPAMDTEKVLRFLYRRRKKLNAVVITGGEPTLQEDLLPFLKLLKAMRFLVKLDTNGSIPETIEKLVAAKAVDYYAMDIKAPLKSYPRISRLDMNPGNILKSMDLIRHSGAKYEFRTTFSPDLLSWDELSEMQLLLKPGDKYYLQECHYSVTLDDLKPHQLSEQHIPDYFEYQDFLHWAEKHHIRLNIRNG